MRTFLALALVVTALAGCERPLVDPLPTTLDVVGVDLDDVLVEPLLVLQIRVPEATALTIEGRPASFDSTRGLFSDTLALQRGLNQIAVQVFEDGTVIATDTLDAVHLPLSEPVAVPSGLPEPRSRPAVALDSRSRVVVTGGAGAGGQALASMAVLTVTGTAFSVFERPLVAARVAHTATALPDGGLLLLGGAIVDAPARANDLVATAEWISPADGVSRPVAAGTGALPLRAGHTTRVLQAGTRTLVYVYGGLVPAGSALAPSGTVDIYEWIEAGARLDRLTPAGGAGAFAALAGHVQIDVTAPSGVVASSVVFGDDEAFRFDWRMPGVSYPFDLSARPADALTTPRLLPAGTDLGNGLALVAGGRDLAGTVLSSMEVYAVGANRTFRLPASRHLAVARTAAAATTLPDHRIIVVGGRTSSGSASAAVEVFTY